MDFLFVKTGPVQKYHRFKLNLIPGYLDLFPDRPKLASPYIEKETVKTSLRTLYYITGQVITLLGFITLLVWLSAHLLYFQVLLHFQERYDMIG